MEHKIERPMTIVLGKAIAEIALSFINLNSGSLANGPEIGQGGTIVGA